MSNEKLVDTRDFFGGGAQGVSATLENSYGSYYGSLVLFGYMEGFSIDVSFDSKEEAEAALARLDILLIAASKLRDAIVIARGEVEE